MSQAVAAPFALYVMTAGRADDDYRFLGRAPESAFWKKYASLTSFEHPTIAITSDGKGLLAYLSGTRSARRDRTHTPLRYTLVLESPCRAEEALSPLLATILAFFKASGQGLNALGEALDAALPEAFLEQALSATRGPDEQAASEVASRVSEKAVSAIARLPLPADPIRPDPGSSPDLDPEMFKSNDRFWWGGAASIDAQARFLGHAARLWSGEKGLALLLNLADPGDVSALAETAASCGVLLASPGVASRSPQGIPEKKGRAPSRLSPRNEARRRRIMPWVWMGIAAVGAAGAWVLSKLLLF